MIERGIAGVERICEVMPSFFYISPTYPSIHVVMLALLTAVSEDMYCDS
jgi:hypothetical protein